jgi:hypothetical protein
VTAIFKVKVYDEKVYFGYIGYIKVYFFSQRELITDKVQGVFSVLLEMFLLKRRVFQQEPLTGTQSE